MCYGGCCMLVELPSLVGTTTRGGLTRGAVEAQLVLVVAQLHIALQLNMISTRGLARSASIPFSALSSVLYICMYVYVSCKAQYK